MRTFGLFALVTLIAACGKGGTDDSTATASGTAAGSTTGTTSGTGGGTATGSDRSATLNGRLLDCGGGDAPAGFDIRFCDVQTCRYHTTPAGDSSFEFTGSLVGFNSFEAVDAAGHGYATGFVPLELATDEVRTVDITLCPHDTPSPLTGTATEMELGEGLYITLSTSSIEPPLFVDPETEASGVRLAPADHVPTDGISGTVVEQWYVDPFNNHATGADLPIRFDGAVLGLAAASYRVYVGSYDDFAWIDVGTFSDGDADGWYTADGGELPLLGTILLVEE